MGGTAGAGDDHLEAGRLGALGKGIEPLGCAVRRDDARLVRHAQGIERVGGMLHGLPVGLAAHDNGYGFRSQRRHRKSPCAKEAPDYRLARWNGKAAILNGWRAIGRVNSWK